MGNDTRAMAGEPNVPEGWVGLRLDDAYGARIGRVEAVYADARDGAPAWLLVRRGRFGDERAIVPVAGAACDEAAVRVPHARQAVVSSPPPPRNPAALSARLERALALHYGVAGRPPAGSDAADPTARLASVAHPEPAVAAP
jgi:hypothetical protein